MIKNPKIDFNLCLITDRKKCKNQDLMNPVEDALIGGVRCVQLREKDLPTKDLFQLALNLRKLTQLFSAKLLINDRLDICKAVDADGIHLPENGLPVSVCKNLLGKDKIIGASTHSLDGVIDKANQGVDFVTLSPIFETSSKPKGTPVLGVNSIINAKKLSPIPILALGGIDEYNVKVVIDAGADGIALISGILCENDIKSASKKILNQISTQLSNK